MTSKYDNSDCVADTTGRESVTFRQGCSALFWVNSVLFVLIGLVYVTFVYLPFIFSFLDRRLQNRYLLGAIGSLVALGIGFGFYRLRQRHRRIYALIEIAVAVVTAWASVNRISAQGDLATWVGLAASAYISVRGFDNYQLAKRAREL